MLWTRELGHSPFAAAPLISDIDADGQLDVIAAPFLDEVTVLRGQDGSTLQGTKWPHTFVDVSTHSSPLMVNIKCSNMCCIITFMSEVETKKGSRTTTNKTAQSLLYFLFISV